MNNPGMLIKQKRKEKRLTLEEVAQNLGVSKSTVSKYERGIISNLKRSKMVSLCNLLDIDPMQLINGIEIEQTTEITINGFKTQISYLLHRVPGLEENEKDLIRNYIDLICTNKGE